MVVTFRQTQSKKIPLSEQFIGFEDRYRKDFDDNGWSLFADKINEYVNDLHLGIRREYITRCNDDAALKYSGMDAERASLRLDFQRLYRRKGKRYAFQIGALIGSLLTGISGNWAFSDIGSPKPSPWPWVILVVLVALTIILFSVSLIKDMEP